MAKRDQSFWSIFNSVIRLEVQRGHLKWTMAELSRASEVGRSSIYHYFGSNKEEILRKAVLVIGEEFFGLSESRMELWKQGRIEESVLRSREMTIENPYLILFFLTWRKNKHTTLQGELINLEQRYLEKLKSAFPQLPDAQTAGLYAIFFGLVNAPLLALEEIPRTVRAVMEMLGHKRQTLPAQGTTK